LKKVLFKTAQNSNSWNNLKKQIEEVDKKINQLVYKLYNLTPEEIRILEKED